MEGERLNDGVVENDENIENGGNTKNAENDKKGGSAENDKKGGSGLRPAPT